MSAGKKKWKACILVMVLFLISGCSSNLQEEPQGIRVAVLDSGLLPGKSIRTDEGWNYLNDSSSVDDEKGHGTQVAELICRYAPDAVIVPLKISGSMKDTEPEMVIRAIYDAVDKFDCKVLCMSFSIPASEELYQAVNYAWQKNVIMISAAGNLGETYKKNKLLYPAAYDEVIGVGAVDENSEVAAYSQRSQSVFVTASGSSPDGTQQGTSYAAARIAGFCAGRHWDTPEDFQNYLTDQVQDCGVPGYDTDYGWGVWKHQKE